MLAPDYPVATARLRLRPFAADDYEALRAYRSREDVARYVYWEPAGPDAVRSRLAALVARTAINAEGDPLTLAVTLAAPGELIGDAVLLFHSAEHARGEIGYTLHPDFAGHGYATEAGEAICGWASRVWACTASRAASTRATARRRACWSAWACAARAICSTTIGSRASGPTSWSTRSSTANGGPGARRDGESGGRPG